MSGPDSRRLAHYRRAMEALLFEQAEIYRPVRTSDGRGGSIVSEQLVGTEACTRSAAGGTPTEQRIAEQVGAVVLWRLVFRVGADVRAGDRVRIDGLLYEVVAPLGPESMELLRTVIAKQVM